MVIVKQLKDDDYGVTSWKTSIIVNLESLWERHPVEELFINNYSKIVLHEYLHSEISCIVSDLFIGYEEFFVDRMSNTDYLSASKVKEKYLWQVIE